MRKFLYFKRREKRGKREAPRPRLLVLRRKTLTVGAALLAAAAIFGAVNAPAAVRASVATRQLPIYCVERDQKVCSISFDAAWGADNTQKILDVLADYGVKATFFVVQLGRPVSGAGQGHRRQRLRADEPFQRTRPLQFSGGGAEMQRMSRRRAVTNRELGLRNI